MTDHAMFLGVAKEAADTDSELSRLPITDFIHDLNAPDNRGIMSLSKRAKVFGRLTSSFIEKIAAGEVERREIDDVSKSAWRDTIEAADEAYVPGRFTAFAGYEYTSSTSERGNLHRNVIFRGSDDLPELPFSRLNSRNPESLWDWMDALRAQGIESLAIPHNSNGSNGAMFQRVNWAGEPIDEAYSTKRMRNEPLVEVTQVKGTSETHPLLSNTDEWADFEIAPYRVATKWLSEPVGSYVREAYRTGLEIAAGGAANPYEFGLIGSSDTHVGGGPEREDTYFSKVGLIDGTPERRGSVPAGRLLGLALRTVAPDLVNEVDGRTYLEFSSFEFWGASGLAAFYYVRVLENPTCRWSTWDALRAGVEPRSDLPTTLMERAWSSPIWYRPDRS